MSKLAERYAVALVALVLAWLLKLHYSEATPEALRWILAPTAGLASLLLQHELVFRAGEGYLSRELSILVSPACAGVNFLIVALLALALGFGHRFEGWAGRARWLGLSLLIAYAVTIVVNVLRIGLSVALAHTAARTLGLSFQSVHRLLGVVVYLGALVALCLTVQAWLGSRGASSGRRVAPALALACYTGVTLVVPLLRGAGDRPEFWSHAAPVSVLVVVSGLLLFAARRRTWDDGRHAIRSPEHPQRVPAQPGALA